MLWSWSSQAIAVWQADRARLDRMIAYAQTALCRWKVLLDYFAGEAPFERCGHCDTCERDAQRAALAT